MSTLERWISQACDACGLPADIAYVVNVAVDREIRTVARIRGLGARNGMLVVRKFEDVQPYAEALARAGYGFSVLEEPPPNEVFDIDSFKKMFIDWGWSGRK